jgi:hypothetical protein
MRGARAVACAADQPCGLLLVSGCLGINEALAIRVRAGPMSARRSVPQPFGPRSAASGRRSKPRPHPNSPLEAPGPAARRGVDSQQTSVANIRDGMREWSRAGSLRGGARNSRARKRQRRASGTQDQDSPAANGGEGGSAVQLRAGGAGDEAPDSCELGARAPSSTSVFRGRRCPALSINRLPPVRGRRTLPGAGAWPGRP